MVDTTKPTLPADRKITVTSVSENGFSISWKAASDNKTPASKLCYKVCWWEYVSGAKSFISTSADVVGKTSHTISNLKSNTEYAVYIYVYDGDGNASDENYSTVRQKTKNILAPESDDVRRKQIREGLSKITYSPAVLVNGSLYNDALSYPAVIENPTKDAAFMLTVQERKFSNKEIYVRGSGYENIYPGSIIFVDEDITAGSPKTLGNVKRNKLTVYGDFLAGSTTKQKDVEPTTASVREASNRIMRILLADDNYEAPGRQQPKTEIYTSMKKLMMDFKVDASFAGINVNVSANTSTSEQKFIQATTLEQDYFTVKLDDEWKQDTSLLFANNVTWQDISEQLNGRAIAIVTSVTYGRTFSYMKEYSAKEYTFDSSQKVKGHGQSASASQSVAETSTYSKDDIFNLGGSALTKTVLNSKKTQEELENAMADNMKFGASNQGVVVKYTIQLITGNSPGRVIKPSYNGKYNEISYTRCPKRVETHVSVKDVRIGDGKVKVQMDVKSFKVENGKKVAGRIVNGDSSMKAQDPWYYTFSSSRGRVYGDGVLSTNEYLYPNPKLRIRSKDSRVDSYRADDEKIIDISSGKIDIILRGSVFAGQKVRIKEVIPQ